MVTWEESLNELPDVFRDLRLNVKTILRDAVLPVEERFAVAVASAAFIGDMELCELLRSASETPMSSAAFHDALAAAAIMSMNTVYYRSVHMLGKQSYEELPPKLRMSRMLKPETNKRLFEQCSLACAALAGCQRCLAAHEMVLRKDDVSEEQIHDVLRIAAIINGLSASRKLSCVSPLSEE